MVSVTEEQYQEMLRTLDDMKLGETGGIEVLDAWEGVVFYRDEGYPTLLLSQIEGPVREVLKQWIELAPIDVELYALG